MKLRKSFKLFVIILNCVVLYYVLRVFISFNEIGPFTPAPTKVVTKPPSKRVSKLITVVIRDFESQENDVSSTTESILNVFPNINLLVLYDVLPYPPVDLSFVNATNNNVKYVNLSPSLRRSLTERYPLFHIKTKYVLFVPDSIRFTSVASRQNIQLMINMSVKHPGTLIAAPSTSSKKDISCLRVHVDIREWTLQYSLINGVECDAVTGKHLLLVETDVLRKLTYGFFLPFPQSLYIQTAAFFHKVKILKSITFHDGKPVIKSHHAQWRKKQIDITRFKKLYDSLKIKKVVRETGSTEWYGCNRDTPRCFGTVIDSMPSFLYEGKWTPPCCLSNLKKTAKYIFNSLDEAGIRYWLEAGSLLGAMRSGDILPWDHDVDIGFNRDDLHRCTWLRKARDRPVVDNKGFLWERATEGNFYRVHFSKANRIYVNLFPFSTKNGTMTRDAWYTSHKNMDFPDNYLHPMSSIEFIGRNVPSPNNIREFLEHKYGKGAIENPEYPDPGKIRFPQVSFY